MYSEFYKNAEAGMKIPGLWNGHVSQGFSYCEERGVYLTCGYDQSGGASRIYILNGDDAKCVEMKLEDGSDYTEHTGGMDTYGDYLYVTGTTGFDLFLLSDVFDGDGATKRVGTVSTILDPAYCTFKDNFLYTGSYYDAGHYETPMEHRMKTPTGEQNTSILAVYEMDPETGKPKSELPEIVFSTTSQVQGMTFVSDRVMVLASSWGISTSKLRFYDLAKLPETTGTLTVDGVEIPVLYLDGTSLVETVDAPPMAEEIVCRDGRIWIMNESACTKYLFGKLTTGNRVYGVKIPLSVADLK